MWYGESIAVCIVVWTAVLSTPRRHCHAPSDSNIDNAMMNNIQAAALCIIVRNGNDANR
jgi:hypothetical protein